MAQSSRSLALMVPLSLLGVLLLAHAYPSSAIVPAVTTAASPYNLQNGWFVFWICKYNYDESTDTVSFSPYWFNGFSENLTSPLDAALPPLGFHAVNGNCEFIVDSSCRIVLSDLACDGCCHLNPRPSYMRDVTCFDNFAAKCSYRLAPLSGQCGEPPSDDVLCNVCNFAS